MSASTSRARSVLLFVAAFLCAALVGCVPGGRARGRAPMEVVRNPAVPDYVHRFADGAAHRVEGAAARAIAVAWAQFQVDLVAQLGEDRPERIECFSTVDAFNLIYVYRARLIAVGFLPGDKCKPLYEDAESYVVLQNPAAGYVISDEDYRILERAF